MKLCPVPIGRGPFLARAERISALRTIVVDCGEGVWSKRVAAVIVVAVCFATLFAVPTARARSSPPRSAFTFHSPILIEGDSDFTPANGVAGGSGTAADPYVISGWDIGASSTIGIRIRNTAAYVAIRGVHVSSNPIWSGAGIYLENVQHAKTENSTIEYNSVGYQATSSTDLGIANCTLHFNDETVSLALTNHVSVAANSIDSNGVEAGVTARDGRDIVVQNNSFLRNIWAVAILNSTDVLVEGNVVRDNTGESIRFFGSSRLRAENNTLIDPASGIGLDAVHDALIAGNSLSDSPRALSAMHSFSLRIERNNFSRAGVGIAFDTVSSSTVTDNFVDTYGDMAVSIVGGRDLTFTRNSFQGGGLVLKGTVAADFDSHNISTDNTVNGLPLRYVKDCSGVAIDGVETGQVVVANCTGVTIANLTLSAAGIGADVHLSEHVKIFNSTFMGNRIAGVSLSNVSDMSVQGNNFTGNRVALRATDSVSGDVWHNSFIQNAESASLIAVSESVWDAGYPIGGNFWSDYGGPDDCWGLLQNNCTHGDGLGDSPYQLDGINSDQYPLMAVNLTIPPHGPPLVTANVIGTRGTNGWFTSPATLTLTATDTGGGVMVLTYSVDGGAWRNYAAPLVFADGAYVVRYTATDRAGNTADVNTLVIRVDSALPNINAFESGTVGADGWFTSLTRVSLHASDNGSGVLRLGYRLDGGGTQDYSGPIALSQGVHFINATATDVAGNIATDSIEVRVDAIPPVLHLKALAATVTTGIVTVSWTGSDSTSGVSGYEVSVDGGVRQRVGMNSSFTTRLTDGSHTITIWAFDVAGNNVSQSVTFRIDTNILSPSGPYAGAPTYGIVLAAAALTGFVLWRRRRPVSPPPASPPPDGAA